MIIQYYHLYFQDGTKLVALVQVLQKRKLRHNKKPVNQHQELENITISLDAIMEDGIKLVNIGRNFFFFLRFYGHFFRTNHILW
jgi:hypothetical protein